MWVNGMMHVDNPLSQGELDENPDDIEFYGYDPDGPSTQEESNNVVIVEPIVVNADRHIIEAFVLERIDPLRNSTEFGIDIYREALELVIFKINELISLN